MVFRAEDFADVESLHRSVAILISWRLRHFDLDAADPACDKIINGGADNTEDEPHHAVDHRHEKTHPEHDSRYNCARRSCRSLGSLRMLRERACRRSQHKNWQEDQTHAGIKYAQHLACLQRCDPFHCAFHIEAIMPPSGVIPVIRFGYVSTSLLFKSDLAHSFCAEDFA